LNNYFAETRLIAKVLTSESDHQNTSQNLLNNFEETSFINTLLHNKVSILFLNKLESNIESQINFYKAFPSLVELNRRMRAKTAKERALFEQVSENLLSNGIGYILIKSDGNFPHESDNVDVIIKPKELRTTTRLLKAAGYSEISQIREPHKFLFRKISDYDALPLHIHTVVEWEGTQFLDSDKLWRRKRNSKGDWSFSIPSPEDCLLITAAHLFFENHEVKLSDIIKVNSIVKNQSFDWSYVFDHSRTLHWGDSFVLTLLLINTAYEKLYRERIFRQDTFSMLQNAYSYIKLAKGFSSIGKRDFAEIPYSLSALFFLKRVLGDSNLSIFQRVQHINWIASDIARRRVR